MNLWDILIILAVGGLALAAVLRVRRRKKGGCGCGCEGCGASCAARPSRAKQSGPSR